MLQELLIEYQAEYVTKLSEKKEQEAKEKAARGVTAPESLVTWIFQDDFIPRARITKEGYSSIMTDYLIWERPQKPMMKRVALSGEESWTSTVR